VELKVRYLGGHKFEASSRGHVIVSDQPWDNGGVDSGMTPPELFLASLGARAGYCASEYLRLRGLPDSDLEIRVAGSKGEHPARFASLAIEISAPHLNERQQHGIQRAVESCLIHNTLLHAPVVDINVCAGGVLALAAV
jgi:putative redox protein